MGKLKVRRINVEGELQPGVYAKDVFLHIIRTLGVKGGASATLTNTAVAYLIV